MSYGWFKKAGIGWTLIAFVMAAQNGYAAGPVSVPIPVAKVNRTAILSKDLEREVGSALTQYAMDGRSPAGDALAVLKKEVLENLIDRQLLLQAADQKGIRIKETVVAAKLDELKRSYSSSDEFASALVRQGLTEEEVRSRVQQGLKIQRLLETEVLQNIAVSNSEIRRYYDRNLSLYIQPEQVRASHILIAVDATASEQQKTEARQRIQLVQSRIAAGDDFAGLAIEFSQCPSRLRGGDLGYFSRDQVEMPFGDAAFGLATGMISPVVESRHGLHLILVTDRQPEKPYAIEDVEDIIRAGIREKKEASAVAQYLLRLRSLADIQRYPL
jgi:parvulin-like peptidyl-prolyl isomerase